MKLSLQTIRRETADASTFIFTPDVVFQYLAGQHVSMMLPVENPDERGKVRTFTLSSSPTEEGIVSITTKDGPSAFKQTLFALPIRTTIEARGPTGSMVLDEADQRQKILLAGGIGIAPFRSMIKYAADKTLSMPIVLLYSNKTPEEIVFCAELDELQKQLSNLTIVHTITQPEASQEIWEGRSGRIDESLIGEHVSDINQSIFMTAGPTAMVEAMIAILASMGVPPENVKFEKFSGY